MFSQSATGFFFVVLKCSTKIQCCSKCFNSVDQDCSHLWNVFKKILVGFHSTETALICSTDAILTGMDKLDLSAMVLLDLSKALDSINHDILL